MLYRLINIMFCEKVTNDPQTMEAADRDSRELQAQPTDSVTVNVLAQP